MQQSDARMYPQKSAPVCAFDVDMKMEFCSDKWIRNPQIT